MCGLIPRRSASDHPRVGGENGVDGGASRMLGGPPPRRRGERRAARDRLVGRRTTPASAGRTGERESGHGQAPDHPRVGGENGPGRGAVLVEGGPPPRRRGEHPEQPCRPGHRRTTPASAGRTVSSTRSTSVGADHPRVGGENPGAPVDGLPRAGPPPRRRGEPAQLSIGPTDYRITPASAGSTTKPDGRTPPQADHPRVGGEHVTRSMGAWSSGGPPPRRRGALFATCPFSGALQFDYHRPVGHGRSLRGAERPWGRLLVAGVESA